VGPRRATRPDVQSEGELRGIVNMGGDSGTVVYEAHHERGDHFYATEAPDLLTLNLKAMFGKGSGER
jgi:hypothetical protein